MMIVFIPYISLISVIFLGLFITLTIVHGGLGSGKTLLLAIEGNQLHMEGIKVYSNFKLKFIDGVKAENLTINLLMDLLRGKKFTGAVFLDEAYSWLEARTSAKQLNKVLSYILFQSRKRGIDFYLTVQLTETIERRFRQMCDREIRARVSYDKKAFLYDVKTYSPDGNIHKRYLTLSIHKAQKYYPNYDTLEIVRVDKIDELEYDLLKRDKKKYTEKVKELAIVIRDDFKGNKFTKQMVKLALLEHLVSDKFAPDVWAKMKMM